jgi:hypothetical protein
LAVVNANTFERHDGKAFPTAVIDFEASSFPMPGSFPIEVAVAFVETGASRGWDARTATPCFRPSCSPCCGCGGALLIS